MNEMSEGSAAEDWATVAFALARDVNRIKRVCSQEHPPKMASPEKAWPAGTETRHSDGSRCVLLEDGDYALLPAPTSPHGATSETRGGGDHG